MIASLFDMLPGFEMTDLLDVVLMSILLYLLLLILQQTRTTFLIAGIAILAALYLTAVSLELRLTQYLLHLVFAASIVGFIVMFHEELRVTVERVLSWRFRWRRVAPQEDPVSARVVETLITTVTDFARDRVGALMVLPGKDNSERFIRGGARLDGVVSEPLLKSIFDPHSLGHDGAVLLTGDRVERFACHLPLSTDSAKIGKRGTRHAAALGLSEKTDCLCLVVSEERGAISFARHGDLTEVDDLAHLNQVLGDFYREVSPVRPRPSWGDALRKHPFLKAAAVALALLLWFLVVHESSTEYRQFVVEPAPIGLRQGLDASIDPAYLRLVVSGPRRSFYFKRDEHFGIDVKLFDRAPGTFDIFLTATDVSLPEGISFVNIAPNRTVRVTVVASE